MKEKIKSIDIAILLGGLWKHVSLNRRRQLFFLVILMVLASIAEVVSLGALAPFLGALITPERIFVQPGFKFFVETFSITSPSDLLTPLTALFCLALVVSSCIRMSLLWATTKLSYGLGADLSLSVYRRTLYQPYLTHVSRNSSELVASMSTKISGVILHIINPILILASSSIILLSLLVLLALFDPLVSTIIFTGLALIYLLIIKACKSRLIVNSKKISAETTQVIKSVREGLGGIRDVLLDGSQEIYCKEYSRADNALRNAQSSNYFISNSPRFVIESAGVILIALIALYLAKNDNNPGETIITLGIFGFGAQRLLPVLQQMYYSITTIKGNQATLEDVVNLLNQPLLKNTSSDDNTGRYSFRFNSNIVLSGVNFRYTESGPNVLEDINLVIQKGKRVGFVGSTGSGKSTLIDIIMGLISPSKGLMTIDGLELTLSNTGLWQKHIAHVPQTIYLIDASIAANIAFGESAGDIDMSRVKEAARKAQIDKLIESWALGYRTPVGERGIRISGGQRQRIAIARALYKQSDVIVFDEATSALDELTEVSLMDAIGQLSSDLTILIAAHRVSTLKQCDQIIELEQGMIKRVGSYKEIIESRCIPDH